MSIEDDPIIAASRAAFEDEVFRAYFVKSIKKEGDGQFPFSVKCEDKATFCARDADGNYVRKEVDAMWFGWSMHREAEHKRKYPGLAENGLRGLIVDGSRDIPRQPNDRDALQQVPDVSPERKHNWLQGARWSHERWLESLRGR